MNMTATITPHLRESKESETLLINQMSLALQEQNRKVYKFGFGQSPFPVPQSVVAAMASAAHRKEYMSVQGHLPLRRAIATLEYQTSGALWHEDEIIIGAGSKILLYCILASFKQADVLLPAPSWVSYEPQADLAGHQTHWLMTNFENKWKISAEDIHDACVHRCRADVPKILILNYPSNPTGQTYTEQELCDLADVFKRHNILVIADEIYGLLTFNNKPTSLAKYYPEGVITTSGLSKWCGAGGWRLGFARVPESLTMLKSRIIGVASETYSCAPSPIQIAATEAYSDIESAKHFIAQQTYALRAISGEFVTALQNANVNVWEAQGGFYLFPDFSNYREKLRVKGIKTSEDFTNTVLQETGVALLAGTAFGMSQDSLTTRLAFVDFNGTAVLSGQELQDVYSHSIEGINALCNWLKAL